ncbi:MAG TPA: NAD(P)-binding domain-containing protein [Steroidobacteraceae bacterium]|nr:NAD(P)-binding domain-containing protein [Steroidobacteraceae bacterium]
MSDSHPPVAIIGAGPYGLSLAAHLRARRVPLRIFGEPMLSWRKHMPRGMFLKSEGFASSIYDPEGFFTLGRYCEGAGQPYSDIGDPVSLEKFVSYGLEFQRRYVPDLEHHQVTLVREAERGFCLTLSTGETLRARSVVVAAGITHFGYLPPELAGHPPELISHSSAHSDLERFHGKTVAVIGGGSSAIDIAALLCEAGADVHLIARRQTIDFHEPSTEPRPLVQRLLAPRSGLGVGWRSRLCTDAPLLFHVMPESFRLRVVKRHLGPAPGWFMKERVMGRFPMRLGTAVRGVEVKDDSVGLTLDRGSGDRVTLEVAHVIAATGYKPAITRLPFLADDLRRKILTADEAPILNRNFECSVPGLYWVGLASANSFGPLARFAFGARFTARRLTSSLAASLRLAPAPAEGFASTEAK